MVSAAARRMASAVAVGGGGLTLLGASVYGVLSAEARMARRTIGDPLPDPVPDATGWYGRGRPGPAIKIALIGDSSACGYGVDRVEDTPGALLGAGVAEQGGRRVYLRAFCRVGAVSADLKGQIDRVLPIEPDVAVILIGGNDITHRSNQADAVGHLAEAVGRLRRHGVEVVVGTCPDLGTVQPIAPPLRQVARTLSRRLAAAQTVAVLEQGGRTVSLGSILGPEFAASPSTLFGPDQFHPSAAGYRALVRLLLPSVLATTELCDDGCAQEMRGEGLLPVYRAAARAVHEPGTELNGGLRTARGAGIRGPLVELRLRRRRPQAEPEAPAASEQAVS